MKKLLVAMTLLILGTAGTAAADRYRDGRGDRRVTVRDRGNSNYNNNNRRQVVRDNNRRQVVRDRNWDNNRRQVVRDRNWDDNRRQVRDRDWNNRRPVYVNNDRYHFHGGRSVVYRRPVINHRYYDYRVRPTILVENYETVPGYLWVAGNWQWNGYEWNWVNGHYQVDTSFTDSNYGYDNGYNGYSNISDDDGHGCND